MEFPFVQKAFAGTAQGYEISSDFGGRIQHPPLFDDGMSQDYTLEGVLRGAGAYVRVRAGAANPFPPIVLPIVLRPAANTATAATPVTPETAVTGADSSNPMQLGIPASFGTYPFREQFLTLGDRLDGDAVTLYKKGRGPTRTGEGCTVRHGPLSARTPPTSWQMGINVSPCRRLWLSHASFSRAAPHTAPCPGLRAAAQHNAGPRPRRSVHR